MNPLRFAGRWAELTRLLWTWTRLLGGSWPLTLSDSTHWSCCYGCGTHDKSLRATNRLAKSSQSVNPSTWIRRRSGGSSDGWSSFMPTVSHRRCRSFGRWQQPLLTRTAPLGCAVILLSGLAKDSSASPLHQNNRLISNPPATRGWSIVYFSPT